MSLFYGFLIYKNGSNNGTYVIGGLGKKEEIKQGKSLAKCEHGDYPSRLRTACLGWSSE